GYVVAPEPMLQRLATRLRATSWMGTPLMAEIASRWIADGTARELLAWQQEELAARQSIVREILGDYDVAAHPNGINAWLTLPSHWRTRSFVSQAALKHVAVTPAEPFVVGRLPEPHAVRISLGVPSGRDELRRGLEILAEVLQRAPEPAPLAL
ncbi:MAG: PLP-dependent aminotransferase family protein, partial [bacterium]